jgi:hypothetical protein
MTKPTKQHQPHVEVALVELPSKAGTTPYPGELIAEGLASPLVVQRCFSESYGKMEIV